jgi:hypothetical protein
VLERGERPGRLGITVKFTGWTVGLHASRLPASR